MANNKSKLKKNKKRRGRTFINVEKYKTTEN
jgi:hypothetical protein